MIVKTVHAPRFGCAPWAVGRMVRTSLPWMAALLAPVTWALDTPSPLRVEPSELALGPIPQHEVIQRQLLLFNDGPDPIIIGQVGKTCPSCLSFSQTEMEIPPGAPAVLDVVFDPSYAQGEIEEYIVLETDLADVGNLAIPLRAEIHPPYALQGAPVFMESDPDRSAVRWVTVYPSFDMQGVLAGLAVPNETFDVRVEPRTRGAYDVEITSRIGLSTGLTQTVLTLASSDPADPPCRIEASVFVPPPFHVYPGVLKIGPLKRKQLRILFTRQTLSPPARIVDVELPDPSARYEFLPDGVAESRLNLYFYGMDGRDGHIGDVVLKTDHPEAGDIRVPVWVSDDYRQTLKAAGLLSGMRKKGCCGGN